MTNRIMFCPSYGEALEYCLQDKELRKEQEKEKRQVKNRAEVLYYHQCYGDKQELVRQFKEVQKLNYCVRKPAFHVSLNLPPGEQITNSRFIDIARDCAKALDFEQHQYVVIRHKDTAHPHIHLVVNRVGPDEHTMEDDHVLNKLSKFCREMEQKYQLTPVKDIMRFRTPEERLELRCDKRVVQLKEHIRQALQRTDNVEEFMKQLRERGYKVYKFDNGIAFKDSDGVYMQGYKAGYPWKKLEAALAQSLAERQAQEQRLELERIRQLEPKQKPEMLPDEGPHQVQRRGLRRHM